MYKTSCTIIVSHFESLSFLRACIRQIRKYAHSEIEQHIIICDQSKDAAVTIDVVDEFGYDDDITVVFTKPYYSGYGIDFVMRNHEIKTDYICQIHVDAFPVSAQWLYLPIKLIEEYEFSFVGQLQFICDGTQKIYPPYPFFAMAQCFNVAKTETYKELSLNAGFARFHNRKDPNITYLNKYWDNWAANDYNKRGSDDDVVAFSWQDRYKVANKLGLAITGFVAPAYGRIIEDVVFHFGSCRESLGTGDAMGDQYKEFTRRINENYSDELIEEMVSLAKANKPPEMQILTRNFWDGTSKVASKANEDLNNRIEKLKHGLD